jgi:hypothetical protein
MRDINRRINTIEKQLSLGQHEKRLRPTLIICSAANSTDKDIESLGPLETWITYQEQLQAGQEANAEYLKNNPYGLSKTIVIELDVEKEYQGREQLKGQSNA